MTTIPKTQLSDISFPDCDVDYFEMSDLRFECRLDGIYVEKIGFVQEWVSITISNWKHVSIKRFDSTGANPIMLDIENSGSLKDICEWEVTNNKISFSGFERQSGHWQCYQFLDAEIEIHFDQ